MEKTVTVQECTNKNGWYNLKTSEGDISVMGDKCPKIKSAIEKEVTSGTIGEFKLEMNIVDKDGKKYGWDIKEKGAMGGGGYKKNPAEEKYKQALIVAQSSMTKAVELCIAGKIKEDQIKATTNLFTQYVYEIADKFGKEVASGN